MRTCTAKTPTSSTASLDTRRRLQRSAELRRRFTTLGALWGQARGTQHHFWPSCKKKNARTSLGSAADSQSLRDRIRHRQALRPAAGPMCQIRLKGLRSCPPHLKGHCARLRTEGGKGRRIGQRILRPDAGRCRGLALSVAGPCQETGGHLEYVRPQCRCLE